MVVNGVCGDGFYFFCEFLEVNDLEIYEILKKEK